MAPTGVTVVTGLDPESKVLPSRYDELCAEFVEMSYGELAVDQAAALNTIAADWDRIRGLLPDRPYRAGDPRLLSWRRALRRPTKANTRYRAGQVLRHGPTRALVDRVSGARSGRHRQLLSTAWTEPIITSRRRSCTSRAGAEAARPSSRPC